MERSAMVALLLFTLLAVLVSNGYASGAPPSGSVTIAGFTYNGDGCPPGSTEGDVSSDGQALTVMFSKYTASTDMGVAGRRRSCSVSVKLAYPPGFIYHLGSVTVRGYGLLAEGVTGTVQSSYYVAGVPGTAKAKRVIKGPFDDDFEFTDGFESIASSECSSVRNLNIKTEVRVDPGNTSKNGLMTIDSADLRLTEVFSIVWTAC
ncbi:hypothetical protein CBR_g2709 [Chara braunii]|uniref:DUF4360 domain-containing protein n=1 Tax=Chara braunii TaxID=69332 RepID=A0A388KDL7_CHABU|nr:hypothetical protein CBR_g2709 [Chara braunii]|eukprot:GBG68158.1 hypothetical protein CBR_g2709 [Chara braunii]